MNDYFTKRLNEALYARRMKPAELARRTGIDRASISSYMAGRFAPKKDGRLEAIARALDVNPEWLAGLSDEVETAETLRAKSKAAESEMIRVPVIRGVFADKPSVAESEIVANMGTIGLPAALFEPGSYFAIGADNDDMCCFGIPANSLVIFRETSRIMSGRIGLFLLPGITRAVMRKYVTDWSGNAFLVADNIPPVIVDPHNLPPVLGVALCVCNRL